MRTLRTARSRAAALSLLAVAGLLAGCASILGDFSATDTGSGNDDGGPGADGAPLADTGSGNDGTITPGTDAGPDGSTPADGAVVDSGHDGGNHDASGPKDGGDAGSATDAADATSAVDAADGASAVDAADAASAVDAADAASAVDAADSAVPWTPTVLDQAGELAVWLEAASANYVISGGLVESWKDQSKNHNDATNSNTGPTVSSSAIQGHDALNFATAGLTLGMADATSLQFAGDQVYITAVARVVQGSPHFFSKFTTGVSGAGTYYKTGLLFYATTGLSDAGATILGPVADVDSQSGDECDWDAPCFEDGKFHIVAMRRTNSSTLELTVDDQPPASASTGSFDVSQAGQQALVGAVQFGNIHPATNFDIAEILAVHSTSGVVADTDVANLHAYLKAKYGL